MTAGLETFAKVRALHDRATIPGEKASAAARMKTLARKAGMSVEQAVSKLDAPKPKTQAQAAANAFSDFFHTPEMRAQRAEREAVRLEKTRELLKRYANEEAVFADTKREAALRMACEPLVVWDTRPDWKGFYAFAGWTDHGGKDSMPTAVREAVMSGWPWPETVAAAWSEYEAAEALDDDRCAFEPGYTPHRWVEARRYALEEVLDTQPAKSLNDLRARMSWLEHLRSLECQWTHDNDAVRLATLRADIERMGARLRDQDAEAVQSGHGAGQASCEPPAEGITISVTPLRSPISGTSNAPVQFGHRHRTNADKRRDVLALLNAEDSGIALTDREIARRAGVSPTTVGTIRRSLA
ncbi:hypothetical protein [Methylobacterium thuringiense]|uniref:Uncharacterized protein n=1 Tax=Methylobacterium thuringiense TaxID=1003091 RepID=A0ABQ4TSC7_9HYPH|nr:hypothetical protein [Methylobacterium thuringiense]GJE57304.1 hypothetical protein EKPJFOCH_3818 [Methylobacterium thuringiense]